MTRWVQRLALIGLSALCPAVAFAHGGDAKILRVAAVDANGAPWLLQLSDGLGVRVDGEWRFVCPAALEAAGVLDALSAGSDPAWAVTARGVWRIVPGRRPERVGAQCGDGPIELVAHRDAVYLLARDSARRQHVLCALDESGPREVYASDTAIDDVTSDGTQLWLVRLSASGLELESVEEGERRSYAQTGPHRGVRLLSARGALYAQLIDFGRAALVRLMPDRVEPVFDSTSTLYGPVESGGAVFAGSDGRLVTIAGTQSRPTESDVIVEDVDGLGGHGFAFANGALYELPVSQPLFSLDEVKPPAVIETEECAMQWQRFQRTVHGPDHAIDAGAPVDVAPGDAGEVRSNSSSSCSVRDTEPARAPGILAVWLVVLMILQRRSRKTRSFEP